MPTWDINFDSHVDIAASDVLTCAVRVEALASVIRDIPIPPGVQKNIDALNILRAVRGTTGIEGAELTEEEVGRVMSSPPGKRVLGEGRDREEKEVRNAAKVMDFVAESVKADRYMPLTENLVCEIHKLTTENIDYPNNVPGHYRNHPAQAGTYVPPRTGEEVRRLMKRFTEWFNTGLPRSWPVAVQAIVAHFYVVSIHPFGDGNGRTARGVESFWLYRGRINARGFYSLANFYYRNRSEYIELLDEVRFRTGGDLTPFVRFGLVGLVSELESVHRTVLDEVRIIVFRDFARETLMVHGKLGAKPGERMYQFLLGLAGEPVTLTALKRGSHWLADLYGNVTSKTLTRDLNWLRTHKFIVVEGDTIRANLDLMDEFVR